MDLNEFLDFLTPQSDRPDPKDPTKTLPKRAGAICQSTDDWGKAKTVLEQACRILGPNCSHEVKKAIAAIDTMDKLAADGMNRMIEINGQ